MSSLHFKRERNGSLYEISLSGKLKAKGIVGTFQTDAWWYGSDTLPKSLVSGWVNFRKGRARLTAIAMDPDRASKAPELRLNGPATKLLRNNATRIDGRAVQDHKRLAVYGSAFLVAANRFAWSFRFPDPERHRSDEVFDFPNQVTAQDIREFSSTLVTSHCIRTNRQLPWIEFARKPEPADFIVAAARWPDFQCVPSIDPRSFHARIK